MRVRAGGLSWPAEGVDEVFGVEVVVVVGVVGQQPFESGAAFEVFGGEEEVAVGEDAIQFSVRCFPHVCSSGDLVNDESPFVTQPVVVSTKDTEDSSV